MLRRALEEAGIAPEDVYITNAVKHFSWEPRGIRRIHKTPAQREIAACHAWLDGRSQRSDPPASSRSARLRCPRSLGKRMAVSAAREAPQDHPSGAVVIGTYHPSALLRAPDASRREELYRMLVADLRRAVKASRETAATSSRR
jgi:DNA polymerase